MASGRELSSSVADSLGVRSAAAPPQPAGTMAAATRQATASDRRAIRRRGYGHRQPTEPSTGEHMERRGTPAFVAELIGTFVLVLSIALAVTVYASGTTNPNVLAIAFVHVFVLTMLI